MKQLIEKIKKAFSDNSFKAGLFTTLSLVVLSIPLIILLVILLLQYSYITIQFWIIILCALLVFVLGIAFSSVLYTKLLNNYNNTKISKEEYKKIFVKELIGPFSVAFLIVAMVVYLDQLSKVYSVLELTGKGSVPFIKGLINFRLAYNKGAAWSICSEHTDVLGIISLIASLVMLYFIKDFNLKERPMYSVALALILGGTIGNMIDRLFNSKGVVDMIETAFMDFPIFNLADSFLVVGTIMLMVSVVFSDIIKGNKKEENENPQPLIEEEKVDD